MNTKKEAAWRGGIAQHISATHYTRKTNEDHLPAPIGAWLKSTIIWFPTHGLMPIVVADWLILFLRLRSS